MAKERIIIIGAAGRDFHNFNTFYRDNENYEVLAFTATQIPDIDDKTYPASLAGSLYPNGIPIISEDELYAQIETNNVDRAILSYSDLPYDYVMHMASKVIACGADFGIMGANHTMIESKVPLIAICAVRTGCGKSQTTRRVVEILKAKGKRVVAIRHPMPYGDLEKQKVQRFASYDDLDKHECTIEEREEYEPHIDKSVIVYAGVDYEAILRQAEQEADVIIWDGGNNDFSFYKSDLYITVDDPHRPGHGLSYYPGETNLLLSDMVIINKVGTAKPEDVARVRKDIKMVNPDAIILEADSPVTVSDPSAIQGKRVLVVEDGPTITHGGMPYGAGFIAAKKFGASEIVNPHQFAVGSLKDTLEKFTHIKEVLPAMGYFGQQVDDLKATLDAADCDVIIGGTPIDLNRILTTNKPIVRVGYDLKEHEPDVLEKALAQF